VGDVGNSQLLNEALQGCRHAAVLHSPSKRLPLVM
jgi:hypothetical protein